MTTLAHPSWCRQYHRDADYHVSTGATAIGEESDGTVDVYLAGEPDRPMVMLALVEDLTARLSPADAYHLAALLTRYADCAEGHCELPV